MYHDMYMYIHYEMNEDFENWPYYYAYASATNDITLYYNTYFIIYNNMVSIVYLYYM